MKNPLRELAQGAVQTMMAIARIPDELRHIGAECVLLISQVRLCAHELRRLADLRQREWTRSDFYVYCPSCTTQAVDADGKPRDSVHTFMYASRLDECPKCRAPNPLHKPDGAT